MGRVGTVAKPHQEESLRVNRPAIKRDRFFCEPVEIERGLNVHELFYALIRLAFLVNRARRRFRKVVGPLVRSSIEIPIRHIHFIRKNSTRRLGE